MKKLVLYMIMLAPFWGQAQTEFKLERSLEGSFSDFTVDPLQQVLTISKQGQLKKFTANGDSLAVFNEMRRHGKLFRIDASNPLKVLLYFKDFGTLVVLDRFLNRRDVIDFRKLGLLQVKAIGQAYDNGIWVYDEQAATIKHLDDAGKVADQFSDFRQLFDSMPSPQLIVDQNKFLYLYDQQLGFYVFDYYGSFKRRVPYTGWSDVVIINGLLFGRKGDILYRYDAQSFSLSEYKIDPSWKAAQKIIIAPERVYLLFEDKISIYKYQ